MSDNYHSMAIVEANAYIGTGVVLGCFVQICGGASIGDQTVIEGLTIIPTNVYIGERVHVGSCVCFIASGSNDDRIDIASDVIIGSRSIIYQGVVIGAHAVISPGSVVQRSIPSMAIVEGSPAKIVGYVGASQQVGQAQALKSIGKQAVHPTQVLGVNLYNMLRVPDIRGNLTVGEFDKSIPFTAKRYFMVYDVPSVETRGEHAHRECHQFLICVRGSCAVVADDGNNRQEFLLDRPDIGIHLPPMIWGIQYKYSSDAVLLVFASHYYDNADYIRDYSEFRKITGIVA